MYFMKNPFMQFLHKKQSSINILNEAVRHKLSHETIPAKTSPTNL